MVKKTETLYNFLVELGLTKKEAKIYLASLSLGVTAISKLARAAEIKRSTAYSVIDSLKQKGLMRTKVKGFKKLPVAESPEKLKVMLELRREQMKELLPKFQALYNLQEEGGFIKYYEGLKAIKSVYEEVLKEMEPHSEYLTVGNPTQWFPLDADYFQDFMDRRAELSRNLNFSIRLLLQTSPKAWELKKFEKNYNAKIKILPPEISFSSNLIIVPRKLVIHQLVPPVRAVIIENQSIIQLHRELFNVIWDSI